MSEHLLGEPGGSEPSAPGAHEPCCSSHGVDMDCARYRRTHFVEVRPCCSADARLLKQENATRQAMLARRDEVHAKHPEVTTAAEFAPLMGDLAVEYLLWHLERMKQQMKDTGPPLTEATFWRGTVA
jgi:hypothetical protein